MFDFINKEKVDALIVSNLVNIKYLSWFAWSHAFLIFTKNKKCLVTDSRYFEREKKRLLSEKLWFIILNFSEKKWEQVLNRKKIIWIESDNFTLEKFKLFKEKFKWIKFKLLKSICLNKRIIKNTIESWLMKEAAIITSKILQSSIKKIKEWISEIEFAWILEKEAREKYWILELSFPTTVAFWENSSYPHHMSWETKLRKWDVILIDFWVKYKWYCSDMTRTFFTSYDLDKIEKYNFVLKAQHLALDKVKSWMIISDLYNVSNDYFKINKLDKYFLHSLWHWLWLECHESPTISYKNNNKLKEGMFITIEPWLYFAWKYWIRIEDTVMVLNDWCDIITKFDKKLKILNI